MRRPGCQLWPRCIFVALQGALKLATGTRGCPKAVLGFSLHAWLLVAHGLQDAQASAVVPDLEHRLSNCGAGA